MNNNLKVVLGTVAGVMIGGITVVGANQAIQAMQNTEIKVSLNGQVQEFRDETTGEKQYPITYNNRTYLPLRNVAQLAGLNVDYDSNSNTAILTTNRDENKQVINEKDNYSKKLYEDKERVYTVIQTINGKEYEIPQMNFLNDNVKKENQKMIDEISKTIIELDDINCSVLFEYYFSDDTLSLFVHMNGEGAIGPAYIYNVTMVGGNLLSNYGAIKMHNISEEEANNEIQRVYSTLNSALNIDYKIPSLEEAEIIFDSNGKMHIMDVFGDYDDFTEWAEYISEKA